jgi:hypothetical protein
VGELEQVQQVLRAAPRPPDKLLYTDVLRDSTWSVCKDARDLPTCEVNPGLQAAAALDAGVAAVELGVGLLKERRPELVWLTAPQEDQLPGPGRQPVVYDHLGIYGI